MYEWGNLSKHILSVKTDYENYIKLASGIFETEIKYDYMVEYCHKQLPNLKVKLKIYFVSDFDKNLFIIKHPEYI